MNDRIVICNTIERRKQEIIREYDRKINEIQNESNFVIVYYLLAKTFNNTKEQSKLGIQLLKNNLTNDFFKSANVKSGLNYIIFSNKDFDVMFSTTLAKGIKIRFKGSDRFSCIYYTKIKPPMAKLADLTEDFLNNKTFKNLKILADYNYRKYKKKPIAIIKYILTYKKCNKKLLNRIRKEQREDILRKKKAEEAKIKHEKEQQYARNFVKSLIDSDLKKFKTEEWHISIIGIEED